MPPPVSLCMIVRNEEAALPTCLRSVADLVTEIIVVDTGSADHTKAAAASLGAGVFDFPWCDDFSAARNESLRHATGDWVLWLDADEFFDEPNRQRLREFLAGLKDERAAYVMTQRSATPAGSFMRVQQVRLFRRTPGLDTPGSKAARWEYRVHEQLLPSLRRAGFAVRPTDVVIQHSGYREPAAGPAKLARNLRLLLLDQAERPDDPFTLFNLGAAYLEQGSVAEAVPLLERSLERSQPGDSIVPKLYAALAGAHGRLGQREEALAVLRRGRVRCPGEPALLFLEGQLRQAGGDAAAAESFYRRLLPADPAPGAADAEPVSLVVGGLFADGDEGLPRSAAHQLALACRQQGRLAEAERLWRGLVAGAPGFVPAWLGLGELFLAGQHWDDVEQVAARLEAEPATAVEALVLRGRACLAHGDFTRARELLGQAQARAPQASGPRIYLTHVLLQEGRDRAAAERALRELVALDPSQAGAWRNLAVLLRHSGRLPEALAACQSARAHVAGDPDLLLLHGMLLVEVGDLVNAEACLAGLLEKEAAGPGTADGEQGRSRRVTARHNLALVCRRLGRLAEAERHWRAALAEMPELAAALQGLGEVLLQQGRLNDAETIIVRLGADPQAAEGAVLLRARLLWRRREHGAARKLLEGRAAGSVTAQRLLCYVLLDEDRDRPAAEAALRALMARDPADAEARHNLTVLLGRQGRPLST